MNCVIDLRALTPERVTRLYDAIEHDPFVCVNCNRTVEEPWLYFKEGCACPGCVQRNPIRSRICFSCMMK